MAKNFTNIKYWNMTIWAKITIFEKTAKNSVLGRSGRLTYLQYEKKIKKFDREVCFHPKSEKSVFQTLDDTSVEHSIEEFNKKT